MPSAYIKALAVVLAGYVQLSSHVHILHGHQALVLPKSLLHQTNSRHQVFALVEGSVEGNTSEHPESIKAFLPWNLLTLQHRQFYLYKFTNV